MSDLTRVSASPFDEIRRVRLDGSEYWSARDLQQLMGYVEWRNLQTAISRAKCALVNTGNPLTSHVVEANKVVERPQGGTAVRDDLELSRHAAYLVAINGDPDKPETASAQAYFAVQTRRAEVDRPALTGIDAIQAMVDELRANGTAILQLKDRQAALEARQDATDGNHGWYAALGYARLIGFADTSTQTLAKIGYRATKLCRNATPPIVPKKVRHALFGEVNSYPSDILEIAFTDYDASTL